jgi:hypothetical protein
MLNHPSLGLWQAIRDRIEAGDKDLRPLLIEKALASQDPKLLRPVINYLKSNLGGIPLELKAHIRKLYSKKDKAGKHSLLAYLNDTSCQDLSTPWILRRWQVNQAVGEMKKIRDAIESYFTDCSMYPNRMDLLLSPVGYLSQPYADRCGISGPYDYYSELDLFNYIIASTGPDGVWNISTKHYLLYRILDYNHRLEPKKPDPIYVKCDAKGNYMILNKFEPGCDIAYMLYDFY